MVHQTFRLSDGSIALGETSRRKFLRTAGGVAGACWAASLQAAVENAPAESQVKSVILIFNCGGPSHLDLWDPKPEAPDNIRSQFRTIDTNVPGIQVTEMLPRLAKRADQFAILRTLHHSHGGHNSGMHWSIVGRPYRIDSTLINPAPADYPSFGTLIGWLAQRDGYTGSVPPYVITPYPHCDSTVYITPGQYGGCLGVRYDPFVLDADPNAADFQVRNLRLDDTITRERFERRTQLLEQFASCSQPMAARGASELDTFHSQATSLVLSGAAARAFDLTREPTAVRERYGRHQWGQSHLLARRLVEAGARIVTTVNGRSIIWDTHQDNFGRMQKTLVPPMEQAFDALLEDLQQRGLLDSTLVVWMGDFGRTPIINSNAGRDHWPQCYSMVLAGGGIRGGQVIGQSDRTGAFPQLRPITPADVHSTVFSALGYDSKHINYQTIDGRPVPLSAGEPIREIL